jgi:hypothetical protein
MGTIARFATKEPTLCAVCRRHAYWLGYRRDGRGPMIWLCDDNRCHSAAKNVAAMASGTLDLHERAAALEAGTGAGGFLDECGTTDLAALSVGQWEEFLRRIIVGYEHSLRRRILEHEPPF